MMQPHPTSRPTSYPPRVPGHRAAPRLPPTRVQVRHDTDHRRQHAQLIAALADGPQPLRALIGPLGVTPERVRQLLRELLVARQVKRVGRHRHAHWALIDWAGVPPRTHDPFAGGARLTACPVQKPSITPKAKPPARSWWLGVPRDAFAATQAVHDARMRGSQVASEIDPTTRERES